MPSSPVQPAASGWLRHDFLWSVELPVVAEDINPTVNELFGGDDTSIGFLGDVSKEQAAIDVVALAVKRFGKLDILVNNAAKIVYKNAVDMTLTEWNSILNPQRKAVGRFIAGRTNLVDLLEERCWDQYGPVARIRIA